MNVEIREVTIKDAQLLFEWANDPETRKNSFHPNPIEWNEHVLWLNNKLSDSSCKMFIFNQNNNPVGLVRIEFDDNSIISVTVAPNQRGKGLGSEILKMACSRYWEQSNRPILAYIKNNNKASLQMVEKAGFKFFQNDFHKQTPCIIVIAEKNGN